jgi:transposase
MTDWLALLPYDVAIRQRSWERCKSVERALLAGATQREIAQRLGISPMLVGRMKRQAERLKFPPIYGFLEQGLEARGEDEINTKTKKNAPAA